MPSRISMYRPDIVTFSFRMGRNYRTLHWRGSPLFVLLLGLSMAAIVPLHAQLKTKVEVETAKPKAALYTTSMGATADRWDAKAYDPETVKLLQDAGITLLRVPGNGGVDALYHFSTGAITNPYTNDRLFAFPDNEKFPAVVPVIDQLGTALVSVNYGSNLDGSGGGEPAEAAAWVAYANGKASSTQAIGKDSKGNDWKSVGYWAALRGSTPLATDDGYNALRIGHPDPLGIMLWTVGNDPYNNGFYYVEPVKGSDADTTGLYGQSPPPEPDLHAGKVDNSRSWGRHENNAKVGPKAYGTAVVEYAKAMKAVDPTIMVGAFLTMPPLSTDPHPFGKNWNADVLKAACGSMDFSAVSFWEGQYAPPTFIDFLDEEDLLMHGRYMGDPNNHYPHQNALSRDYSMLAGDLIDKYKKFCPAGRAPQLAVTNFGYQAWMPAKNPAAYGIFAADSMATLLESGAYTVVWAPIHAPIGATSASFLDSKNQPQPGYYGIKLLHTVARPGDVFVNANSQDESLAVHAVKRRGGGLGLLLINKNLDRSVTATVTVDGYSYATKGTRYDWGKLTLDAGKQITETPIEKLGPTFTVEVPRYGITAIVIPNAH